MEGLGVKPALIPDSITDEERVVLLHLVEECSEVIEAACHIVRHGKNKKIATNYTYRNRFGSEVGNLELMIQKLSDLDLVDVSDVLQGRAQKRKVIEAALNDPK